jgi:hypothetical protein
LAVQWLHEALCFISSSAVAYSFRLRNRQIIVAAKRYPYENCARIFTTYHDRLFGHLIMVVSMLQSNIMNAFNNILIEFKQIHK